MALRAGQPPVQEALRKGRQPRRKATAKLKRTHYVSMLCRTQGLPEPEIEVKFHPVRKWRLDYGWRPQMVALEREGGVWIRGRHTRGKGFEEDCVKYAEAALLGWTVFRASPQQIINGTVLGWLQRALVTGR